MTRAAIRVFTVAEVALVAFFFGAPAAIVAVSSLWISRRFGLSGIRFLLGTVLVLLAAAAIVSAVASTRLDAIYADRRALAENFGGLAAAIVTIAILESARGERLRPHRNSRDARAIRSLSPVDEEP